MLSNENKRFTDKEIIEKGARVLIKELGYSGFLRFIRQMEGGKGEDYLKIDEKVFEGMDLDDIYEKAKEHWYNNEL